MSSAESAPGPRRLSSAGTSAAPGHTELDGSPFTGVRLLDAIRQVEKQLDGDLAVINGLNVFPVPDGDTGTNMLATVRDALRHAEGATTLTEASGLLAAGAMLGARGNSGVILSQFFRALDDVLSTGGEPDLAALFARASELAYRAVTRPVEGTMLTVMAAGARAAEAVRHESLERLLATVVDAATEALSRTPEQLPILGEAQVVDAGGYGFVLLLRGLHQALVGRPAEVSRHELAGLARIREQAAAGTAHPVDLVARPAQPYGYCITVLVDASQVDEGDVRQRLATIGDSVLVVASGGRLKMHLHTPHTEPAMAYARELGAITAVEISNIDDQTHSQAGGGGIAARRMDRLAVVAVVPGDGLIQVFRALGAAATVLGGPGQNPSAARLLEAVDAVRADQDPDVAPQVFLLPNHDNVLAAARQAGELRSGIIVVPTASVPQGVAALLAFNTGLSPAENEKRMTEAIAQVVSAEMVRAVRPATIGGVSIASGDMMAVVEGQVVGAGNDALERLLDAAKAAQRELATIYRGISVSEEEAETLRRRVLELAPNLHVEVVRGGQPHSHYIFSFE